MSVAMNLALDIKDMNYQDDGPDLGGEGSKTLKISKLGSVGEVQQKVGQVWTSLIMRMMRWIMVMLQAKRGSVLGMAVDNAIIGGDFDNGDSINGDQLVRKTCASSLRTSTVMRSQGSSR